MIAPEKPRAPKEKAFETSALTLRKALGAVLPARGRDQCRPGLCAVFVTVESASVMMEATDGHRLHRVRFGAVTLKPGEYRVGSVAALDLLARAERRNHRSLLTVSLRPRDPDALPTAAMLAALGVSKNATKGVSELRLNPGYIASAFAAAAGFGCSAVMVNMFGDEEPMTVTGEGTNQFDDHKFTAIVMPVRIERTRKLSEEGKEMVAQGIPVVVNPEAIGDPNLTPIVQMPKKRRGGR